MSLGTFEAAIAEESASAREQHRPLAKFHEGYAVLLEEVEEFWDSIKRDDPDAKELIQIGAVCRLIWKELFGYPVQEHPPEAPPAPGTVTNVLNHVWLQNNVGSTCRFLNLGCLQAHLKKLQHQGETSFAGGPIQQEITLVDMMLVDCDFFHQSRNGL